MTNNYGLIPVNNKRKIKAQFNSLSELEIDHIESDGKVDFHTTITQGDFISMLNWYYYQKEHNNKNLLF